MGVDLKLLAVQSSNRIPEVHEKQQMGLMIAILIRPWDTVEIVGIVGPNCYFRRNVVASEGTWV